MASRAVVHGQVHVMLTLRDGERSFGMSLAQKTSGLGLKYTVVSSVFVNSPAYRAGVRTGYVVRRINEEPMGGLSVAQVASRFRNVGQARITLEVTESAVSPKKVDGTAFGGRQQVLEASGRAAQRPTASVAVNAAASSSGRAIAAPGSALAAPKRAARERPTVRLDAMPEARSLALQPRIGVAFLDAASVASTSVERGAVKMTTSNAGVKRQEEVGHLGLLNKHTVPRAVQCAKAHPRLAQPDMMSVKPDATATTVDPAAKSVSSSKSLSVEGFSVCRKTSQAPVEPTKASSSTASASAVKERDKSTSAALPKSFVSSGVHAAPSSALVAAANATTSGSAASASFPAPKPAATPGPNFTSTVRGAVIIPPAASLPSSAATLCSTSLHRSPVVQRTATTGSKKRVPTASVVSTTNSRVRPAQAMSLAPAIGARKLKASQPGTKAPVPVPSPEQVVLSGRGNTVLPVIAEPRSNTGSAGGKTISAPSTTRTTTVASVSAPPSPTAVPTSTPTKIGMKRGRQQTTEAESEIKNDRGAGKEKRAVKQQQERDESDSSMNDDGDAYDNDAITSDYDSDDLPIKKSTRRRTENGRRRGPTDRIRHSLTIDRLVAMGFRKEDAEASVKEIGDHLDACMVWIISKIEERQFNEDLNQASIQSEQSKHDEKKRVEKLETERLVHAEKFMAVFPTSYMVCPESTASHFKAFLQSVIDQVDGGTFLREVLTELMKLEGKSIRWYKDASRSYMLELAERLDGTLRTHDVISCCSRASASDINSVNGCEFVRKLLQEVKALTKALFEMPTNQGGVPQAFLKCDATTKFDLEDDGFEVLE
uniref:PDZ domain-containing protein n=1 Tax=Peronospora matthiolae TaxID=2874970 RepID=A0AAV1TY14_9STRA